jgi:hypothetical protein
MSTFAYDPITGLPKQKKTALSSFWWDPTQSPGGIGTPATPGPSSPVGGGLPWLPISEGGLVPPVGAGKPTFDWKGLIEQDPLFKEAKGQFGADRSSNRAQLIAALRRGAIQFGEIPDVASLDPTLRAQLDPVWGEAFNPETQQLAAKGTGEGLTTTARLEQQRVDQQLAMRNALAARGIHTSGESGYQEGRQQQQYKEAQFDARNSFLNYISEYQAGYAAAERAIQEAERRAAEEAARRQWEQWAVQNWNAGGGGEAAAPAAPAAPAPPPIEQHPGPGGYVPPNPSAYAPRPQVPVRVGPVTIPAGWGVPPLPKPKPKPTYSSGNRILGKNLRG